MRPTFPGRSTTVRSNSRWCATSARRSACAPASPSTPVAGLGPERRAEAVSPPLSDMPGLYAFETLLRGAGDDYFNGLRSPVWPEAYLGKIAWHQAVRGQQLYQSIASAVTCRRSPNCRVVDRVGAGREGSRDQRASLSTPSPPTATRRSLGLLEPPSAALDRQQQSGVLAPLKTTAFERTEYFLDLYPVDLGTIRTDPGQAMNFAKRVVDSGDTLLPSFPEYNNRPSRYPVRIAPIGIGLQMVTIALTTQFYDRVDAQTPAEREEFIQSLPANMLVRDDREVVVDEALPVAVHERTARSTAMTGTATVSRERWRTWATVRTLSMASGRRHRTCTMARCRTSMSCCRRTRSARRSSTPATASTTSTTSDTRANAFVVASGTTRASTGNSNDGHLFQDGGPGNGIIGPLSHARRSPRHHRVPEDPVSARHADRSECSRWTGAVPAASRTDRWSLSDSDATQSAAWAQSLAA